MRLIETEDGVDAYEFPGSAGRDGAGAGREHGTLHDGVDCGDELLCSGRRAARAWTRCRLPGADAAANGTVTGTLNWNDLSGGGTQAPITRCQGRGPVDTTGRMTVSNLVSGSSPNYAMARLSDRRMGMVACFRNTSDQYFSGQVFSSRRRRSWRASFSGLMA